VKDRHDLSPCRFLVTNQPLFDSLFVNGVLDEHRLDAAVANFRRNAGRR